MSDATKKESDTLIFIVTMMLVAFNTIATALFIVMWIRFGFDAAWAEYEKLVSRAMSE